MLIDRSSETPVLRQQFMYRFSTKDYEDETLWPDAFSLAFRGNNILCSKVPNYEACINEP